MKRLLNHRKAELLVLAFCLLAPVVFWGCGKDDKDVAQNPLSSAFTSSGTISSTYFANPPTTLALAEVGGVIQLSWLPPSDTTKLVSYNIYNSKDGGISFSYLASVSSTPYTDTTATTAGTYFYRVAAMFSVYDPVSNYTNTVLSKPTDVKSIKK